MHMRTRPSIRSAPGRPVDLARLLLGFVLLLPLTGFAITIDEAKAGGLVGEDASGYLAAVADPPNAEVAALVTEVNEKRRAEYTRIAAKNGIDVVQVEQLAGKKAIERTASGHYVRLAGEDWRRK